MLMLINIAHAQQNKGTITVKELQRALQSQNMTNAKVEELFNSADVDNR
jgi:Ca2+-binding EF-hand superfamily protein